MGDGSLGIRPGQTVENDRSGRGLCPGNQTRGRAQGGQVKLVYRPLFLADVEQCADYLATEAGEAVAAAWYQALKQALQHIQKVPEIGRVRQDLPVPEIRTLNLRKYPNYLVFYR